MKKPHSKDVTVSPDVSDEEIVKRVKAGEDSLFDEIVARYQAKLSFYVIRYTGNEDEAHDVVQEALIKAHKNIATFDGDRRLSPWLYRIAHNEAVNYLTKRNKKQTISLDDDFSTEDQLLMADVETASLESWFQKELRDEMRAAIAQLPEKYASVIHMRFIEDLSYTEISERIGKPTSTVGTLVRRAKRKLLKIVLESEDLRP